MQKTQVVNNVHLSVEGMRNLDARLTCPSGVFASAGGRAFSLIKEDGTNWEFYEVEEFLAEYRPGLSATYARSCKTGIELRLINHADYGRFHTRVIVKAPEKAPIEAISKILDQQLCVDFSTPGTERNGCRAANHSQHARCPSGRPESRRRGTQRRVVKGR